MPLFILVAVPLLVYICLWLINSKTSSRPPGPSGRPFIGNLLDMPSEKHWLKFTEWASSYGEIVHLNILRSPMVILSSMEATNELLEVRSINTSDRQYSHMVDGLMGWDFDVAFMPYSSRWRQYRRLFHESFNQNNADKYYPIQRAATIVLLDSVLTRPDQFLDHIKQFSGSVILRLVYGVDLTVKNEAYLAVAEEAIRQLNDGLSPGRYFVEIFPFLKYIPAWFPGAGFKRKAALYAETTKAMIEDPYQAILASHTDGTASACFVTEYVRRITDTKPRYDQETIKNCAAAMFIAGGDTTTAAVSAFMLAAVLYPDCQRKAQAELDAIVGKGRLPDFSDRRHLPYLDAIISEIFRWNPTLPMGFPHRTTKEEVYKGFHIPKGSLLVPNAWGILRNEKDYPDPDHFKPERFMSVPAPPDPMKIVFGFGRRVCPGRYLAINSVWLAIASILVTFTISRAIDDEGNEIVPDPDVIFSDGYIRHTLPFKCRIDLRSENAAVVVRKARQNLPSDV